MPAFARPELISGFCSGKVYFYSPLDGMLVQSRVTPSIKFVGTHLYTWAKRGTVRVECLAQEHNTMSPARTGTRTARIRDDCTSHEATAKRGTVRVKCLAQEHNTMPPARARARTARIRDECPNHEATATPT